MKKFYLAGGAVLLLVLLAFAWSFAQMEMEKVSKKEIKMMSQEPMSHKMCAKSGGGMMHQMGCCQKGHGMGMCGGMMGCRDGIGCCQKELFICCEKELGLTDKQVKDLQSIKMDYSKGSYHTEADLKIAQLELKVLMQDDNTSLKDIEAKMNAIAKLETDLKLSCIKACRQAKALLTPEQMEKIKKGAGM
jgi:hypothetical protein